MDGFLILHGKGSGPNNPSCSITPLAEKMISDGLLVDYQAYSWGINSLYHSKFEDTENELRAGVQRLRARGATRVHLVGHSMGVSISFYYAIRNSDFDSIVGLAGAHNIHHPRMQYVVKWSVAKAKKLTAEGNDDVTEFVDWSAIDILALKARPSCYLSYFDPEGNANMATNVRRVARPLNVLMVSGTNDTTQAITKEFIYDIVPKTAYSSWIVTNDDHGSVCLNAYNDVIKWVDNLPQ